MAGAMISLPLLGSIDESRVGPQPSTINAARPIAAANPTRQFMAGGYRSASIH